MLPPNINQADYGVALSDFLTERAVYLIDGAWRVNELVARLRPEQKGYIELKTFPGIPNMKGRPGSTAAVAGAGYGMNGSLTDAKADAAWKWIWFHSGPVGSAIRQGFGMISAYRLPPRPGLDPMIQKMTEFLSSTPSGYVIDAVMDPPGVNSILNPLLKELISGRKNPKQVADAYEAWVKAGDSNRKR